MRLPRVTAAGTQPTGLRSTPPWPAGIRGLSREGIAKRTVRSCLLVGHDVMSKVDRRLGQRSDHAAASGSLLRCCTMGTIPGRFAVTANCRMANSTVRLTVRLRHVRMASSDRPKCGLSRFGVMERIRSMSNTLWHWPITGCASALLPLVDTLLGNMHDGQPR